MTVQKTNRSHRVAYMLFLLVLAVALTTALVLAGERSSAPEKQSFQFLKTRNHSVQISAGGSGC
jgi:hypothetical protein